MKTSNNGIALIKKFEGCKLFAYKCLQSERFYTIGYGHYGTDVKPNSVITMKQADDLLKKDITKFENWLTSTKIHIISIRMNMTL